MPIKVLADAGFFPWQTMVSRCLPWDSFMGLSVKAAGFEVLD